MREAFLTSDGATQWSSAGRAYSLCEYSGKFVIGAFRGDASDILSVVEYLSVNRAARYRADKNTYCNIYAADVCTLMGAYLPRVWWLDEHIRVGITQETAPVLGSTVREMTANEIHAWLLQYGSLFGWKKVATVEQVQVSVASGAIGLISARAITGGHPGHISIVLPSRPRNSKKVSQSHAGRRNARNQALPKWWLSDSFAATYFWVHSRPTKENRASERQNATPRRSTLVGVTVRAILPAAVDNLRRAIDSEIGKVPAISANLRLALIAAEDRRYLRHPGFDLVSIARALVQLVKRGPRQGASTIEQQLVRTLTGRREQSVHRKVTEIMLAVWCGGYLSKREAADLYLSVAYYGRAMNGIHHVCRRLGCDASRLSIENAAQVVAALKYPLPSGSTSTRSWSRRVAFIATVLRRTSFLKDKAAYSVFSQVTEPDESAAVEAHSPVHFLGASHLRRK